MVLPTSDQVGFCLASIHQMAPPAHIRLNRPAAPCRMSVYVMTMMIVVVVLVLVMEFQIDVLVIAFACSVYACKNKVNKYVCSILNKYRVRCSLLYHPFP